MALSTLAMDLPSLTTLTSLPPSLLLPLPIFIAFLTAYRLISPHFPDSRSRAYILSAISSFSCSIASVPFVYAYCTGGVDKLWATGQGGWTTYLADFIVVAFGTYLFSDLVVGYVAYRDQVGLLTGWIHHTVYIGIMVHLVLSQQAPIFLAACIMEVPTFDLAISHLFPAVRSDERFLTLMAITRILFNAVLVVDCARPSSRAITEDSWVPTSILTLAFVLHASWMHGGVKGYLKRRRAVRGIKEVDMPSTPALTAASPDFGPLTPDESPLVTPHTPSQPTVFIRDGLFPTITIPTMPNLPIPAIPKLSDLSAAIPQAKESLNSLNIGFKEAVRERWEEQRERLAARGLRLRRKGVTVSEVMAQ